MDAADMVRTARRRAGLTQRELARRSGIPQPTISRIERGLISPTFDTLRPLIEGAGMELLLGEPVSDGVDRSLIREQLRRSPADRLAYATKAANALARMRRFAAGATA
jgi:transcriptional regulator with XRE-family HTH domain